MTRQETDWGEILWMDDKENSEDGGVRQGVQVGIVTLRIGAHQPRHIHYEEQVVYVLQGEGLSYINGEESDLKPGSLFHWKAGVEHEIYNTGKIPLKHLLIANPERTQELPFENPEKSLQQMADEEEPLSPDIIYVAVEAIRTQFLETLPYGYVIFDRLGNLILQSRFMPEYCEQCCSPSENPGKCSCMVQIPPRKWNQEQTFHCVHGMEVFHYPIYFRGMLLGYIQSGYIRHTGRKDGRLRDVYDVPESVITGIRSLMGRILKAIRNYCEFEQFRRSLTEKEVRLVSTEANRQVLIKNLQDTQSAMTDLKINHHFLFNTLNSMASMALDDGSVNLYRSIVDLSKMFHYTLQSQNSVVTLEREYEYVRAYLQLQKLRYGDGLEIVRHIQEEALAAQVPFNFLQPVVENAFTHGFDGCAGKKLKEEISLKDGKVEIRICNSGTVLTEKQCNAINRGIHGNTSHGLAMVYRKLRVFFDEFCTFEIQPSKNGMTCFLIRFPFRSGKGERRFL